VELRTPHSKKLIVTKVEQRKKLDSFKDGGEGWWQEKMGGYCSTGQSPQRAVVPMEEEEEEDEEVSGQHYPSTKMGSCQRALSKQAAVPCT
jgi:hypothetical protein